MHFSTTVLAALLGVASAQNVHVVSVGTTDGSPVFKPDNIKANVGEMIQFQFRGGNHSVAQSTFDNPCSPISQSSNMTGFFTGYQPVDASQAMGMIPTYTMMVTSMTPMWLYCTQAKHCQNGMVMVVNENTGMNASRSLPAFKKAAAAATANVAPSGSGTPSSTGAGSSGADAGAGTGTGTGTGSAESGSASAGGSTETGADAATSSSPVTTDAGAMLSTSASMGLLSVAAAALMML
ncbi:hypothetical protein F4779DRAFT_613778 [Xylariaceae sp. FL0662B]|nr:hypothetical protein F4779DRAFT_613778 [Xylariaceae sp. FL0662B]